MCAFNNLSDMASSNIHIQLILITIVSKYTIAIIDYMVIRLFAMMEH